MQPMNRALLAALAAAAALTACGGGSGATPPTSSPTPAPTPTPTPTKSPASYSVTLRVSGGAMGSSTKDLLRRPMSATPVPLQMTAPDSTDPLAGGGVGASGVNMYVDAQVAPSPSSPPPVSYSASNPAVQVSPGPTPAPGSQDMQAALLRVTQPIADAAGSFVANVGGPVNQSVTRALIVYPGMTLYATVGGSTPSNEFPGYTVDGGVVAGTYDVSKADIWIDIASSTIRTPYGSTLVSNASTLADLSPAQWAATYSTLTYAQLTTRNPDGSLNDDVLFKGAKGAVCEYMVITTAGGSGTANAYANGPVQCHGTSINGF